MRFALLLSALLSACAPVHELLPAGPVLSHRRAAAYTLDPPPSGARYTGPPRVDLPPLPEQLWAVHYALDLVLVSEHPDWSMHEYARIDLPSGSIWLAKDADPDGVQGVVADLPEIESWLPEIPVPRRRGPVEVEDRSEGRWLDYAIRYTNLAGEPVEVHYRGRWGRRPPARRNGSTMHHSRQAVAAVLDIARETHGQSASVRIGGRDYRVHRVLGLLPMRFALDQTQGGFAVASFLQLPAEGGFELLRPAPGEDWPTRSRERWSDDGEWLRRDDGVARLEYRFPERGGRREWAGGRVYQAGEDAPLLVVRLDRALPDLRRPFEGELESRFVVDIHGQEAHGRGRLLARWTEDGPEVDLLPEAPWWFADRPMRTEVRFEEGGARVRIQRLPGPGD